MKFLVDSCVSRFAVAALRDAGFDTLWIPELGDDPGDEAIMRKAFEGGMILVTADKDFGDLVFNFNLPHPPIVRLVDIPPRQQGQFVLKIIGTHGNDIADKALITADRYRIRVRFAEEPEEDF
jgi:predicted nuclease of predicted toxin-antitoxin system